MGLVSGNRLNRFWQRGVKPIKDAIGVLSALSTVDKTTLVAAINELAEGKFDVAKLVASTNITEPGFAMDGKTASEAFAELSSNSEYEAFDVTLTEGAEGVSVSAFRCNGVTSISFLLNAGAKSVIRFSVPVKFRPIYTVSGSFSCTSTDRDSGKCAGVTLSSSGIGFIWILTPLEGSCYASIVYPSSNNQS